MTLPAWPAIPAPLNPVAFDDRDPVLRSKPGLGLQAFRRRQTQAGTVAHPAFLFNYAEWASFVGFWASLQDGVGWFTAPWLATLGFKHHQARFIGPYNAELISANPWVWKVSAMTEFRDQGDIVASVPYPWRDPWWVDPSAPPAKHAAGTYADEVLADAPLAYWKCNDTAASIADSSGNSHPMAAAAYARQCSTLIWEAGDTSAWFQNSAVNFGSDFVPNGAGAALTLEAWVKLYSVASGAPATWRVLYKGTSAFWELAVRTSDGKAVATFYNAAGSSSQAVGTTGGLLDLDTPTLLASSINTGGDGKARLYVNGQLEATASTGIANIKTGTSLPKLMEGYGYAGHVAVYASDLSASRHLAHYNAGKQ